MLRALEVDVVAQRQQLPEDATDVEIIRFLADSDRVFVTENRTQLTRSWEAVELKAARINAVYFANFWNRLGFWAQAAWLVNKWPQIDEFQRNLASSGTIVEVKQNGKSLPIAL